VTATWLLLLFVLAAQVALVEKPVTRTPQTMVTSGTVRIRNGEAFSFETTASQLKAGTFKRSILCWPHGQRYVLEVKTDPAARVFDASVCPYVTDPARLDPEDCVRFSQLPFFWGNTDSSAGTGLTTESNGTLANTPRVLGSSMMSYRRREFEFFFEDAMTPTMAAWVADEWQYVDGRLRQAFATFLAANIRVSTGMGDETKMLLALLPISDLRRFEKDELIVEKGSALCAGSVAAHTPASAPAPTKAEPVMPPAAEQAPRVP
jgi:hypothetical protein